MKTNDQLPPNPRQMNPREFSPIASTLPPLDLTADASRMSSSSHPEHHDGGWTPAMAIAIIFVGSFIIGVLFTSSILAGYIEIQPAVIKGFIKSLLGKG